MELLPKWELTGTLPAFCDDESSTCIEMTYKLYQTMQTLISEYNSFADSVNSKILAFESQYNSDFESFTTSIRQEIQEFTNTFDTNILTSSYGNFIAELLSNDNDVSTLKRKLIDQLVNDISITQLIQYIRTIAMTMKVTKSNLDTVKSAMIAKNLNEKYPKLFEITCEGIPEQIHLMNSESWYNSFTQLIAKILSNQ